VKQRRSEDRRANTDVALVPQLREANQNLMLATIGAQDAQAAAEAANQCQTEFLSMLAHELRNPLHPIIMANALIGKISNAHPDLPTLHGIIQRQAAQLVRLVDDLLDASRVNAGKISIETSWISLQEIIESAVETSQPIIETRRQHLEFDCPAQAIFIDGDLIRLTQVFSNLLLNASKYTPEFGHLFIRVTSRQHKVEVAVIDDGAGVPLDIQPRIFELFVQGQRPQVPAQSGLGIGLSLVRTIVQLHRGTVSVSSAGSGTGSQFIVTLPRTAAPHLPG
jgi:signal transduction histidine kinase